MAYAIGAGLLLLGAWVIFDRRQFALDNARWHGSELPVSSDRRVRRLSSFGFALFGVLLIAVGAYMIALAARLAP